MEKMAAWVGKKPFAISSGEASPCPMWRRLSAWQGWRAPSPLT